MVFGGLLVEHSFALAFLIDAATSVVAAALVAGWLPETRQPAAISGQARSRSGLVPGDPTLLAFVGLAFVFFWIYNQAAVALPLALHEEGLSFGRYGLVMAVNGIAVVLLQSPVTHLVGRVPRRAALALGALTTGSGFGLFAFASSIPRAALAVLVWTVGEIVYSVTAPAALADMAPAHRRGRYQGLFSASLAAASVLGPLGGGLVMQLGGRDLVWLVCAGAGAVTAAGYLALPVGAPASSPTATGAVGEEAAP